MDDRSYPFLDTDDFLNDDDNFLLDLKLYEAQKQNEAVKNELRINSLNRDLFGSSYSGYTDKSISGFSSSNYNVQSDHSFSFKDAYTSLSKSSETIDNLGLTNDLKNIFNPVFVKDTKSPLSSSHPSPYSSSTLNHSADKLFDKSPTKLKLETESNKDSIFKLFDDSKLPASAVNETKRFNIFDKSPSSNFKLTSLKIDDAPRRNQAKDGDLRFKPKPQRPSSLLPDCKSMKSNEAIKSHVNNWLFGQPPKEVTSPKLNSPKLNFTKIDSPKIDSPKIDSPKIDSPKVYSKPSNDTIINKKFNIEFNQILDLQLKRNDLINWLQLDKIEKYKNVIIGSFLRLKMKTRYAYGCSYVIVYVLDVIDGVFYEIDDLQLRTNKHFKVRYPNGSLSKVIDLNSISDESFTEDDFNLFNSLSDSYQQTFNKNEIKCKTLEIQSALEESDKPSIKSRINLEESSIMNVLPSPKVDNDVQLTLKRQSISETKSIDNDKIFGKIDTYKDVEDNSSRRQSPSSDDSCLKNTSKDLIFYDKNEIDSKLVLSESSDGEIFSSEDEQETKKPDKPFENEFRPIKLRYDKSRENELKPTKLFSDQSTANEFRTIKMIFDKSTDNELKPTKLISENKTKPFKQPTFFQEFIKSSIKETKRSDQSTDNEFKQIKLMPENEFKSTKFIPDNEFKPIKQTSITVKEIKPNKLKPISFKELYELGLKEAEKSNKALIEKKLVSTKFESKCELVKKTSEKSKSKDKFNNKSIKIKNENKPYIIDSSSSSECEIERNLNKKAVRETRSKSRAKKERNKEQPSIDSRPSSKKSLSSSKNATASSSKNTTTTSSKNATTSSSKNATTSSKNTESSSKDNENNENRLLKIKILEEQLSKLRKEQQESKLKNKSKKKKSIQSKDNDKVKSEKTSKSKFDVKLPLKEKVDDLSDSSIESVRSLKIILNSDHSGEENQPAERVPSPLKRELDDQQNINMPVKRIKKELDEHLPTNDDDKVANLNTPKQMQTNDDRVKSQTDDLKVKRKSERLKEIEAKKDEVKSEIQFRLRLAMQEFHQKKSCEKQLSKVFDLICKNKRIKDSITEIDFCNLVKRKIKFDEQVKNTKSYKNFLNKK